MNQDRVTDAIEDARLELAAAKKLYPVFASSHEGYAIIKEELDELWEEVRKKPAMRSKVKLRAEAKQVAAMALRFMVDLT